MPIITLLTDFGGRDGFVGAMKGVILDICPEAVIVDISHDIAPQDIREGAFVLRNACPYFPDGTIHVAVVDPGVGSHRRAIVVETSRHLFVGPDNGIFAYVYRMEKDFRVTRIAHSDFMLPTVSRTFHGRDVFAPIAAHLANGVGPKDIGPPVIDCDLGNIPEPLYRSDGILGHVIHLDRFGNIITDISEDDLLRIATGRSLCIEVGRATLDRLSVAYADVADGEPLALVNSAGLLEVAVRDGDAARQIGVKRGDDVTVTCVG
ncbi:MAG: SAM-dependent chlorinase/fluorinase [candidate division Zixibacteria bacterium]|nr:SAM-dependent chlorinase/fluorinase [candidate division Zixibacteria bacterium]